MPANFITINSADELAEVIENSHIRPVVLFKHSTTCGISAGVRQEVSVVSGDIHVIIVQTQRPLAIDLAERTGIRHESPQAIVLRDGAPVYFASHYDIEPAKLQAFLDISGSAV